MTLITVVCIVVYLMGCVLSLILIDKFNRNINENERTQAGEGLVWSLLSWIFVFMIVLVATVIQITESQIFKKLKAYFEGKLR